jgi:cytoskeletal protein CcmA (bactofilin family)
MTTFRPDQENSVYIGEGVELSGSLRARDSVVIDGAFDGDIVCNQLVLGQNGSVKGRIEASTADVAGYLQAEIVVKQLLAVRATGRVEGTWDCGALEVARGAVLQGSASVTEQQAKAPAREASIPRLAPPEPDEVEEDEAEPAPAPRRLTKLSLRTPRRAAR